MQKNIWSNVNKLLFFLAVNTYKMLTIHINIIDYY